MTRHELLDLVEDLVAVADPIHVVGAREFDIGRPWNVFRQVAAVSNVGPLVVASVDDQRRHRDLREKRTNVCMIEYVAEDPCGPWARTSVSGSVMPCPKCRVVGNARCAQSQCVESLIDCIRSQRDIPQVVHDPLWNSHGIVGRSA